MSSLLLFANVLFAVTPTVSPLTFQYSALKLPKPINYAAYDTSDDTIYIFGGLSNVLQQFMYVSPPKIQNAIFKWNMNAIGTVSALTSTTQFPFYCTTQCTASIDGNIYIFGVKDDYNFGGNGTVLIFDTNTEQFMDTTNDIIPKMPYPQSCSCVTNNEDLDEIYLFGGQSHPNYMQILTMDTNPKTWSVVEMPFFRKDLLCSYVNGNIYLFGGYDYNLNTVSDEIWKYNLNETEWIKLDNLAYPTRYAALVKPPDINLIYIIGGDTSFMTLATVQVFNTMKEELIGVSYINTGRIAPMSSYNTIEEKIYIFGGSNDNKNWIDSIEYTSSVLDENEIFTNPPTLAPTITAILTTTPTTQKVTNVPTTTSVGTSDNGKRQNGTSDNKAVYISIICGLVALVAIVTYLYHRKIRKLKNSVQEQYMIHHVSDNTDNVEMNNEDNNNITITPYQQEGK